MEQPRALLRFLRPYRHWATLAPLAMVLEVAMDLLQPLLVQQIIDHGVARGDADAVLRIALTMLGVMLIGLVGGMACTVPTWATNTL